MSRQAASTLSPSSSMTSQWKYDVFLSFSGEDTRQGFTDHLFAALKWKGILTFKDDEGLDKGKSILSELLKAIEESRFAIIIFSRNYASSRWCLDELAKIVRCRKETGLTILPIFYDVNPSDVRNQTETFGQTFNKHIDKENIQKVETWRDALKEVASISGWHLQDRHEAGFIQRIVEEIFHKLNSKSSSFIKDLVGIDSSVEELFTSYLGLLNNVCMIGICGMGGLGKTTLARAVYNRFSNLFEGCSFIVNVREVSKNGGLVSLQQQLLKEVLKEKISKIWNVCDGVDMIKSRLHRKRVLLVLDDVNQLDQLKGLAGERDWFGLGSWIIITTRDERLLFQHGVRNIYSPNVLNSADALKLFCLKAFKNENLEEGYKQLSQKIVHYAKGLPLALVTLGSFLFGRTMEEWKSALFNFKQIPQGEIFDTLKVSYDGLEETWKEIFLDIACFFRGKKEGRVIELLKYRGFEARIGINVLMERSLITIENERLWMHDLLQEMGRQIVLESHKKPGKRSRLWSFEDLLHVLKKDTAAEALQAIVQNRYEWERQDWNSETFSEAFSKMCNLRLLIIYNVQIPNGLNHVSNNLRFLQWIGYPSECLPSSFQPKELLELCLCDSKMKYLWKGVKYLDNLKCMDLRYSNELIKTPDFRGVPRLERLHLSYCNNLVEIHPSIGQLSRLIVLDLEYCVSLIDLPSMSSEMESLKILKLCGCSKIRKIPEFKGIMRSLSELHLDKTAIEKLPSSIECLTALTLLSLRNCQYLTCLPRNKDSLRSLEKLVVIGCSKLDDMPEHLQCIKCLEHDLSRTAIRQPLDRKVSVRCRSLSPTPSRFSRWQWIPQLPTKQLRQGFKEFTRDELRQMTSLIGVFMRAGDDFPAVLPGQSSWSQPWSQCSQYNESSVGMTLTILKKTTIMLIKVDLQCHLCRKKIKKLLCRIPQIQDQVYNEKENCVAIKVVCSCPEKIKQKISYKGGGTIKSIEIRETEKNTNPPKKGKEPKRVRFADELEKPLEKEKPPEKQKPPQMEKKPPQKKDPEPVSKLPLGPVCMPVQPGGFGTCCTEFYGGRGGGPCLYGHGTRPWPGYNESSVEVTFTKLNHNLQGLLCPKTGYETSIRRKEDGFGIAFQIIIPGYQIPWWITHQRSGNSISIELPPNWCNSRWMGFALCASLDASYSHISVEQFDLFGETFGLKARVIARGDTPHSYYATKISCNTKLVARHIWLLYLPRDDWFATARSGEFNQIEVVFESSRPGLYVRKCGLSLVYNQDVQMFIQTMCSSNRITLQGWDGSHNEFDNLWRNCDDHSDNEPSAICSSSEEIESCISSVNGKQILYPSNISVSHQKNCYCPARASLKTIFTTHENFGRFWSCCKIKQNVNCGFFEWEDPEMCSHERRVICELQERLERIDKDKVDQDELVLLREKERMLRIEQNKLKKLLVLRHKENKNLRIALLFSGIALLFSWMKKSRVT